MKVIDRNDDDKPVELLFKNIFHVPNSSVTRESLTKLREDDLIRDIHTKDFID